MQDRYAVIRKRSCLENPKRKEKSRFYMKNWIICDEMKRIKTAIVGCGVISDVYMQSLGEKFSVIDLRACADIDQKKMQMAADKFGIQAKNYEEILEDPEIEMIINLTSPVAHYSITKDALLHGKHVYSEKTLTVSFEQAKDLCRIARENNVRLGCAPDTFLGGGIQTARYVLDKDLIGRVLSGVVSITRDYRVYGENLPHLYKTGGSVLFDMGSYYITALCSLLGRVSEVTAFGKKTEKHHTVARIGSPHFGKQIELDDCNVITAILKFENNVLVTLHLNSSTILNETFHLELYGENGVLRLGDPNTFNGEVTLEKTKNSPIRFPFTHGFQEQSRGLGAAEMAWSIIKERPHRASMEMACHVMEVICGIFESIASGNSYIMSTDFERPLPLPEGFIGKGFWEPVEESALI
jgi:predicted dehydrogenase